MQRHGKCGQVGRPCKSESTGGALLPKCKDLQKLELEPKRDARFLEVLRRSAFGLIAIYNMLPQTIVDEETVCGFQRCLQEMAKQEVAAGNDAWSNLFSPRIALYRHPLRCVQF